MRASVRSNLYPDTIRDSLPDVVAAFTGPALTVDRALAAPVANIEFLMNSRRENSVDVF
jgi:hypothetical protein